MLTTTLIPMPKLPITSSARLKLWTEVGLGILGSLIRNARTAKGLSLEGAVSLVYQRTGYKLSKKTTT